MDDAIRFVSSQIAAMKMAKNQASLTIMKIKISY